jgi:type I restriction enzyme S subunit
MLREFQFQLPTLIEQRRIVDLVSSVDSYIFALQQQADAARAARNAVLSELLSAGGEDWTETTLGDISNFISLRVTPAKLDAVTPYVGLEHLVPRSAEISDWDTVRSISSSVTPFEPGDTLFGRLRPYLHKVAFAGFAGTCSPELLVLRSNTKCDAGFLYLLCALDSTIRKCVAMSAGTRMPRTSTSDLASIEIQLPPVVEQQRIVSVISSLDEVIRSTEQAVAGSKRLRSGLLSDLLAGKHEIPESYDRLFGVT